MKTIKLAHSDLTKTIYAIIGKEKIDITNQAIAEVKAIKALEQEPKTITKMHEDIAQEMCEGFCKYTAMEPPEGKDENWLYEDESPCGTCPLNRL